MASRVRVKHLREAGHCAAGARDWFESHGLSWKQFLLEGISVEDMEATQDILGINVAAVARADETVE